MIVRQLMETDLDQVLKIYGEGLATKCATFETNIPSKEVWHKKYHPTLRFAAEIEGKVVGWITLSQVSSREVYRGVGEISVYISELARGKGVGTLLMEKMIQESEKEGFWTLESSIFAINSASIALHEKVGFRIVGTREKIAMRDGKWHNTTIMERRSKVLV
ncbi:GNAT family N-acetyltransferase [Ureibacillus manganicus]|uniref:Phosphinothricin acetyltransferase n=1 Tax=Ureibacillus manganicus DSM 26584 TaxID=1384049 RepID=A0A0A3I3H9_9BACL|nr:GNAT family N-acetyltransferase [Ureibacillus manganicus]KGR77233.1 phosphinothricin acetyltransferase [Ureibacillus manganicus DSM 26584]